MSDEQVLQEEIVIRPRLAHVTSVTLMPLMACLIMMGLYIWLPASWVAGRPYVLWASRVVLLWGLFRAVRSIIEVVCTSWILTGEELRYRRGWLLRQEDYVELYRINDYVVRQTLSERLLGIGSLYVFSTDTTTSVMRIYGINQSKELQQELRRRVERRRMDRRVVELTNGVSLS